MKKILQVGHINCLEGCVCVCVCVCVGVCVCVYYDDPLFSLVNIVNKKKYEDTDVCVSIRLRLF